VRQGARSGCPALRMPATNRSQHGGAPRHVDGIRRGHAVAWDYSVTCQAIHRLPHGTVYTLDGTTMQGTLMHSRVRSRSRRAPGAGLPASERWKYRRSKSRRAGEAVAAAAMLIGSASLKGAAILSPDLSDSARQDRRPAPQTSPPQTAMAAVGGPRFLPANRLACQVRTGSKRPNLMRIELGVVSRGDPDPHDARSIRRKELRERSLNTFATSGRRPIVAYRDLRPVHGYHCRQAPSGEHRG
jgi:hypothetical protein